MTEQELSLFGEIIEVPSTIDKSKKIIKKIKEPKVVEETSNKQIKSKKLSSEEKVELIKSNVYAILGQHLNDTLVIKTKEEFIQYIDRAIANGIIALDTETNNSLDPITCKLMGPCIYTPGLKQAYIPINHIDINTKERLNWQLTEDDCREQFQRLVDNNVNIIFHNAKFDYEVIKCTCGVELPIYWDTLIGARLLNENESASLKEQYILHINPDQEKYSIEKLFEKEEYAIFDPDVFSLYAATDAMMTYQLYEYQKDLFQQKDNQRVFNLFKDVELPCIKVVAEMELSGIEIDLEYCNRLSIKYHKLLDEMYSNITKEVNKYSDKISAWRKTPEAQYRPKKKGKEDEYDKSKSEQLDEQINLSSPTQLAIFLYDVLGAPVVDNSKPRGTGKDELTKIYDQTGLELCNMLLEYKKMSKLVESFLDTLPEQVNSKTGRIHCNFNQIGADTGRFSCSNPNLQQVPSKSKDIRLMFCADSKHHKDVEVTNEGCIETSTFNEVLVDNKWKNVKELNVGDVINVDLEDGTVEQMAVIRVDFLDGNVKIHLTKHMKNSII